MSNKILPWKVVLIAGILFCILWVYFYYIAGGFKLFISPSVIQKWQMTEPSSIYEVIPLTRPGKLYHYDRGLDKSYKVMSFGYYYSDDDVKANMEKHIADLLIYISRKYDFEKLKKEGFGGIRIYAQEKFKMKHLFIGNPDKLFFIPFDKVESFINSHRNDGQKVG